MENGLQNMGKMYVAPGKMQKSGKVGQGHCQYFLKYLKYNDDVVAYKS